MRETLDTIDPRRRESDAPFLAEWCLYRYSASRKHAGDGLGIVSAIGRFKDDSIARLDTDKRILEDKFLFFTLILLLDGDRKSVVSGKSVSVRVGIGGCGSSKNKKKEKTEEYHKREV